MSKIFKDHWEIFGENIVQCVSVVAKKKSSPLIGYTAQGIGFRLSSHEKLCAERMKLLIKSIDDLNKKVSKLTEDVSKGKGVVSVLVFLGALIAGVLGYLNIK